MAKATERRAGTEETQSQAPEPNDEGARLRLAAARADRAAREERLSKVGDAREALKDLYRQRDELNAEIAKHEQVVANPDVVEPDLLEVIVDTLGPAGIFEKGDLLEVGELKERMPNADLVFLMANNAIRAVGAAEARIYRVSGIRSTSKPLTEFGEVDFDVQTTVRSGGPGVSSRAEAATALLEEGAAREERADAVMAEEAGESNAL